MDKELKTSVQSLRVETNHRLEGAASGTPACPLSTIPDARRIPMRVPFRRLCDPQSSNFCWCEKGSFAILKTSPWKALGGAPAVSAGSTPRRQTGGARAPVVRTRSAATLLAWEGRVLRVLVVI